MADTPVAALVIDPTSGFHRKVGSNELLVDGNGEPLKTASTVLSKENKAMEALLTTVDGSPAVVTGIAVEPTNDGYVAVLINGVAMVVGDGVKTEACYFSGDGGVTARPIADIEAGDILRWNGSIALFQLDTGDRVDFLFNG